MTEEQSPLSPETNGTSARRAPETPVVDLDPKPRIAKLSRTAFLGAALLGLVVLTVLSFRYSRESLSPGTERARPTGPAPLAAEQLERLRPPGGPDLAELWNLGGGDDGVSAPPPPAAAPTAPPASRPPSRPARPDAPRRIAPLAVSLPSREGGGRSGESELASAAARLARQRDRLSRAQAERPQAQLTASDPRQLAVPETNAVRVELSSPASEYVLQAGTYVPAVLTQAMTSEIGGPVRARIVLDLRDSIRFEQVLIPRGTLALGRQSRQPLLGERRLLILWERLVLPDGRSLDLLGEPAAGADGTLGVPGRVNRRWGQRFGAAALLSVLGAGLQLAQPQRSADFGQAPSSGQVAAGAVGLELGRLSQEILRELVNLPPTVSLSPGARVHMLLTRDLAFEQPYRSAR